MSSDVEWGFVISILILCLPLIFILRRNNLSILGFVLGIIIASALVYIFAAGDWGVSSGGKRFHHYYLAIIAAIPVTVITIAQSRGYLKIVPETFLWFMWGIITALVVSELIFVAQNGISGYVYVD